MNRGRCATATILAALAVGGCSADGTRHVSSTTSTAAASSAPATATVYDPAVVAALEHDLLRPGAEADHGSAWCRTPRPTVSEFVAHFHGMANLSAARDRVQQLGVEAIAHRCWQVADRSQPIDGQVVLIRFGSERSADLLRRAFEGSSDSSELEVVTRFSPSAVLMRTRAPNRRGDDHFVLVARVGTTFVYLGVAARNESAAARAIGWSRAQLGELA